MKPIAITATQSFDLDRFIKAEESAGDTTVTLSADGATVTTMTLSSMSQIEFFKRIQTPPTVEEGKQVILSE